MKHPIYKDQIRWFLAKRSFLKLVIYFLVISILTGGIIGVFLFIVSNPTSPTNSLDKLSFLDVLLVGISKIFGYDWINLEKPLRIAQKIVFLIANIFSILLTGIILGTIIFKLLIHHNVLVFKKKMNLYSDLNQNNILSIRFYSSTKVRLTNLSFQVILRIRKIRPLTGERFIENYTLDTNKTWAYATTHAPKTIYIELREGDVDLDKKKLNNIQGIDVSEDDKIWVVVSGDYPEFGNNFTETYEYLLNEDIIYSRWKDIDIDYNKNSLKWKGWDSFNK